MNEYKFVKEWERINHSRMSGEDKSYQGNHLIKLLFDTTEVICAVDSMDGTLQLQIFNTKYFNEKVTTVLTMAKLMDVDIKYIVWEKLIND